MIEKYFDLKITRAQHLDCHFSTEVYIIDTDKGKYIVKSLPIHMTISEDEGLICEYLHGNGIKVARLIKSKNGKYVISVPDLQITVQEYIEGETFAVNSAPDWFMEKSA